MGAGTRNSPIAIDDSEDEIFHKLYRNSEKQSPLTTATILKEDRKINPPLPIQYNSMGSLNPPGGNRFTQVDKKRKRASSVASANQDTTFVGPSNGQRQNSSLVNRLSQLEGKKARKRRRRAERQALEEARLQNINWLGDTMRYNSVSHLPNLPATPLSQWGPMDIVYPSFSNLQLREDLSYRGSHEGQDPSYRYPYEALLEPSQPVYKPPPSSTSASDWVSSMAWAADHSLNHANVYQPALPSESGLWSPLPTHAPLPPDPPPPIPPAVSNNPSTPPPSTSRPVEQHALPSKLPPPRSSSPIGMMPDSDPSSKHGTFHFTASTKEVGGDIKKPNPSYLPNPARTLVIEQLPKTHRNPDFIKSWSRSACGLLPVHIFIDGQAGKALIEFATAELARKVWASPQIGVKYTGLKPHQLKGKIREDLIKVWWYRLEGVGADAGVGEIEEGEIEGDIPVEKEVEVVSKKETKKERKARLAKEREAKRLREEERRKANEQQFGQQDLTGRISQSLPCQPQIIDSAILAPAAGTILPLYSNNLYNSTANGPAFDIPPPIYGLPSSTSWNAAQAGQHSQGQASMPTNNYPHSNCGPSPHIGYGDRESIGFSARPGPPLRGVHARTTTDYDELDEEVDMDMDDASPVSAVPPALPLPKPAAPSSLPIHSSLPPRPPPATVLQQPKSQAPTQKPVGTTPASAPRRFVTPPPIQTLPDLPPPPKQPFRRGGAMQPTQRPTKGPSAVPAPNPLPAAQPRTNRRGGVMQAARKYMVPPANETLSLNPVQKIATSDPQSVFQQPTCRGGPIQSVKKSMLAGQVSNPSAALQQSSGASPPMDVPQYRQPTAVLSTSSSKSVPHPPALPATSQKLALPPPPPSNSTPASSYATASTVSPPSEPRSMKSAPTEPSFTKRALIARQKELEAKIAQSKMELAAATNKAEPGSVPAVTTVSAQAQSQSVTHAKPSMDLGEKQAMEDRLRKLVLQSRKPAVQIESPSTLTATSSDQRQPRPHPPNAQAQGEKSTVPISAPSFSLEDMAVSFITQTIETMKARPGSVSEVPYQSAPAKSITQSQADVRSELAAKQQRLEDHIAESKRLMTQLSQAHTKSEKESIMRIIREKTRQFEEASARGATFSSATKNSNNIVAMSLHQRTTTQQFRITRWPGNCEDAGLLIVSDDEDEDEEDDD